MLSSIGADVVAPRSAVIGLLLLLLFAPGLDVAAQDGPRARAGSVLVRLRGRVIDEVTRAPLEGAFVAPVGSVTGYMTDSLGLWALEVDPNRAGYPITGEQLGYSVLEVTLGPTAGEEFTTVKMSPNPIAVEGLKVLVDRFQRRRRFYYGSVRVVDQTRLLRFAGSAYDVVRREVPFASVCIGAPDELCAVRRGRRIKVDLCIDEVPTYGATSALESYDSSELYLVEVYDRGRQIRVYTRWFVERALRQGRRLQPLEWGCA